MRLLEQYKENMLNSVRRLEKKNLLLTLLIVTGAAVGITHKTALKYSFICADILLIVDTVAEMVININIINRERKVL